MASSASLTAGGDIDSYCQKCGFTLAHIIVAVAAGKIARVECKTCHAVHGFRRPPGSPAPKASRSATRAAPRAASSRRRAAGGGGGASLVSALRGRPTDDATPWSLSTRFEEDQLMRHPRFAVGVVQRVMSDDKVEVLFADPLGDSQGPGVLKVLAHARRQN